MGSCSLAVLDVGKEVRYWPVIQHLHGLKDLSWEKLWLASYGCPFYRNFLCANLVARIAYLWPYFFLFLLFFIASFPLLVGNKERRNDLFDCDILQTEELFCYLRVDWSFCFGLVLKALYLQLKSFLRKHFHLWLYNI